MVYVDLTREELKEMVEKYFRDDDGKTKIFTDDSVDKIVEHLYSFEKDGKIELNLKDYFHYNITFWESVEEAEYQGFRLEYYTVIEDNNEALGKSQIILLE